MNVLLALRLRSLPGLGTSLVLAVLWLGVSEMKGVQSSFGDLDTPAAGAPDEDAIINLSKVLDLHTPAARVPDDSPWPVVNWAMEPAPPGREGLGWPVGEELIPGLRNEVEAVVLSLRSAKGDVVLNFGANQDLGLGPVPSIDVPTPGEGGTTGPNDTETGRQAGPTPLGNATFNQAADSLNAGDSGAAKVGDLSRQLPTQTTTPNVAESSRISGWAIAAVAALAVIVAMAIGYYENDRDDRKRRRSSRKSRRRHRGVS